MSNIYRITAVSIDGAQKFAGSVYEDHYTRMVEEGWQINVQRKWTLTEVPIPELAISRMAMEGEARQVTAEAPVEVPLPLLEHTIEPVMPQFRSRAASAPAEGRDWGAVLSNKRPRSE
jgi:hypothetical protein